MRNLLIVCAALVVILGIVSGGLWYDLQSARQQIVDLQNQLTQSKISGARSVQVPTPTIAAPTAPPVAVQPPEPQPFRPAAPPAPAAQRPVALPSLTRPLPAGGIEERRVDALAQSDRTATARVRAWSTVLNLTPQQLDALNAATTVELRRETEESLQIDSRTGNGIMDAQTAARLKVETVTRQHDTLVRILEKMKPQLTPEQSNRMGTMFDGWLTANMARARAEQQAVMSGN